MEKIDAAELLAKAETEEKNYNWEEAAGLYEQAAQIYLEKKALNEAARVYNKFGDICLRAVKASETRKDYLYWNEQTVKAFHKAENLFSQVNNKPLSMECKAKALNALGLVVFSVEKGKAALKESINICLDLNKIYSSRNDNKNLIKSFILTLDSIVHLLFLCKDPSDFEYYIQKSRKIVEKAWTLLKEIDNINFRTNLLYWEYSIINFSRYTKLTYGDKKEEEIRKKILARCKETLDLVKDCDDLIILYRVYGVVGSHYCFFGTLYAEEQNERLELVEKGFDLLEKAIIFSRTTRDNIDLIWGIYGLDYLAGVFGRFEYYQKRILSDVHELQKLSKVYDGLYTYHGLLTSRIAMMYYWNFAGRSFLKDDTRKSYAKLGIKYARQQLEKLSFGPFFALTYEILTELYSHLVILATEDDPQEEYIQKMFFYADQAENSAKGYKGGLARSAGFASIYRANKTMADIVKNKEEKIQHSKIAIDAQKSNIKFAIESDKYFLAAQMRLGFLYEELGIIMTEEKPLMESRDLFLHVIKETSEKGYYYYTAACYEYIARLEDRLGNHIISAEHYENAQNAHTKSLQVIEYRFLKERINEKINYAYAWSLIEKAKASHKKENHLDAKEQYEKACDILKDLPTYNLEASYFSSWAILEEAEQFSKEDRLEEAISGYEMTKELFDNAIMAIRSYRKMVRRSNELKKLEKVAKVRINYSSARINLEKARILTKKGDHVEAAERFATAATQFKNICKLFKIKREREELEAVYYLCKAWESMELAETSEEPNKYANSANLFLKASELFTESKLKYLALGNSNFNFALEQGCNFDKSHELEEKTKIYLKVKSILRNAADSYDKGGFKSGADWALATSTYFDAAWHLIQADNELEINKRKELLDIGVSYLKAAAELFGKSGYKNKKKEILERLDRVKKEEKILVSALNTIKKPSLSRSIEGIVAPSCPIETSQSPRISEIQQFTEEVSKFLEKDRITKKYEIVYKDLLKEYPETLKKECKVGIAQIGLSDRGDIISEFFDMKSSGLLGLKQNKLDDCKSKVKNMIEKAHKIGIDILIFPEMTIDLNYKHLLDELLNFAKLYKIYIIPGSYHDQRTKRNVSMVVGPQGILWEQEKHIPAIIHFENKRFKEGIEISPTPRKTIVCDTEFGRIAIVICRDFLDMDLRVELKNFEPPVDIVINPAFTPVTADFKAAHFDARRSIYAYCFFVNVAEFGESLIYTPEKERIERMIPAKEEGLIYKDVDIFKLRSERKRWEKVQKKEKKFIQSTR